MRTRVVDEHPLAENTVGGRLVSVTDLDSVDTGWRPRDIVQTVGWRSSDIPARRWESFAIFAAFAIGYIWFGEWLVAGQHVVGFAALDRLDRALMIWHNHPAKLSAVGFDYPPLETLFLTPLTIVAAWARSLTVVPLVSALFAAYTMVTLNVVMRRVGVVPLPRMLVLLVLGCNPLVVLYASDGAGDFAALCFVVSGIGSLFAWYITADIRFVLLSGLGFAVAALTGYSSLLWFVVAAAGIVVVLARNKAKDDEVEGSLVGFAVPTVYALALWAALSLLLTHRAFAWITQQSGVPTFSFGQLVSMTGRLVLDGAPLAIVVFPALVILGAARRDAFALWCAAMLAAAIALPAIAAALKLTSSPMDMDGALPILIISVIGAFWIARSVGTGSTVVAMLLVVALLGSIPWTFTQMKTFPRQDLESSFVAAVSTGRSQEGARTLSGQVVGVDSEQAMADWIRANVTGTNVILTDNAKTYAVILLTGEPAKFFDRVDKSDGPWMAVADAPAGQVQYLLLSRDNPADLLTKVYPAAAAGTDRQLPVVFQTTRYTLVRVPAGYTRRSDTAEGAS